MKTKHNKDLPEETYYSTHKDWAKFVNCIEETSKYICK